MKAINMPDSTLFEINGTSVGRIICKPGWVINGCIDKIVDLDSQVPVFVYESSEFVKEFGIRSFFYICIGAGGCVLVQKCDGFFLF